ncbi:MAG: DUF1543 domain-containing protein [Parachlamydiaceae bacterium]|nr:DUF1543 domain-containing protein [Parachlamydiaceae bacterium]
MVNDLKLFAVYLGGSAPRSNIELHDVVFVTGRSLKETHPKLIKKWFAFPEKIPHIDSYIELMHADGFQISLTADVSKKSMLKLYFVNFGAYTENLFGEVHQSAFYVGKNKSETTLKARQDLCVGMIQPHLDDHLDVEGLVEFDKFDVDDVIEVESVDGYHLIFTPSKIKTTSLARPGYSKLKSDNL